MRPLPDLRLVGATILREGELRQRSVAIARGRIAKGPLPAVDLEGYLILPGIVDLLLRPDPVPAGEARPDARARLAGALRQAAACGITTAWLAPCWSWPGGRDDPAQAQALLGALAAWRAAAGATPRPDLRPALAIEAGLTGSTDQVIGLCHAAGVELAWFENGLGRLEDDLRRDSRRFAAAARRIGLAPGALARVVADASARRREIPRHLCRIAEALDQIHARYGSVGDTGGAARETHSMIGAALAAAPAAHAAAAAARAMGDPVLLSAAEPQRLRDLLAGGLGDAIVSDGAAQGLVGLALGLGRGADAAMAGTQAGAGQGPDLAHLPRIWPLLSQRPAEIMGLADRGRLDLGCRADLVVVAPETGAVEATISAGRLVQLSGEAARRFHRSAVLPDPGGDPDLGFAAE